MTKPIAALTALALGLIGAVALAADVTVGQPAPEFELSDQNGQLHSLEDYRDRWVVLYFYPKDETPGCTTEACEFRDNIFAFNRDSDCQSSLVCPWTMPTRTQEFAEKYSLPFHVACGY